MTDGLSNTIYMAEKAATRLQELNALNPKVAAQHGWFITGNWGDTLITSLYPSERLRQGRACGDDGLDQFGLEHAPRGAKRLDGRRFGPLHQGFDPVMAR